MFQWLASRRQAKQRQQLNQRYLQLLAEARDLQRNGDIQAFASKSAEAEAVGSELEEWDRRHAKASKADG